MALYRLWPYIDYGPLEVWPSRGMAYIVMAYIVMVYIGMACIRMALHIYGLYIVMAY